jgi:hypothetical protein
VTEQEARSWEEGAFGDYLVCPHCDAVDGEHTDYPRELEHDGDTALHSCHACGRDYVVTLSVSYEYATGPREGE